MDGNRDRSKMQFMWVKTHLVHNSETKCKQFGQKKQRRKEVTRNLYQIPMTGISLL